MFQDRAQGHDLTGLSHVQMPERREVAPISSTAEVADLGYSKGAGGRMRVGVSKDMRPLILSELGKEPRGFGIFALVGGGPAIASFVRLRDRSLRSRADQLEFHCPIACDAYDHRIQERGQGNTTSGVESNDTHHSLHPVTDLDPSAKPGQLVAGGPMAETVTSMRFMHSSTPSTWQAIVCATCLR